MDPEAFATVAQEIVRGGTPAHCRTAVGRAYYSVFNTAIMLLANDIRFPRRADKHTKVRHYLENCRNDLLREVASQLADLKDKRTQADYEMAPSPAVEDAVSVALSIETARRLNSNLRSVLTGSDRSAIVQAIADYMKMVGDRP